MSSYQPFVIGICGGSGSGKTSFLRQVRELFSEDQVCVLSQDDYYLRRELQQTDPRGVHNFDLPKSLDKKGFIRDLKALMTGQEVRREEYTFNNEQKIARELVFRPAPVIIVEGLFVFHYKKVRKLLDLKVFIHAKENLKVIRRIKRDQIERNYPLDDVLYRYEHHVLPTFERFIKPYMEESDLIINNNEHFGMALEVFQAFIDQRIRQSAANKQRL